MNYPEATVGAVIFNPDNKILICKSHKWDDKYIIPGGHIELGEKMETALRREVKEETNLDVFDIELISITESVYDENFHEEKHFIFIDFLCRTDSDNVILNEEAEEYEWIDLAEVDNYELVGVIKPLLNEIKNRENSNFKKDILYGF